MTKGDSMTYHMNKEHNKNINKLINFNSLYSELRDEGLRNSYVDMITKVNEGYVDLFKFSLRYDYERSINSIFDLMVSRAKDGFNYSSISNLFHKDLTNYVTIWDNTNFHQYMTLDGLGGYDVLDLSFLNNEINSNYSLAYELSNIIKDGGVRKAIDILFLLVKHGQVEDV